MGRETCEALRTRLFPLTSQPLDLRLTDNRSTIVFVRRRHDRIEISAHRMFARAPAPVLRALARYAETADRDASRTLGRFIDANRRWIRPPAHLPAPAVRGLRTEGRAYDLAEVFADLNRRYFDGRLRTRISWGPRRAARGARRSIKLGTYCVEDRLIRVHVCLDRPDVPRYFVESVVFHEMLHARHPIPRRHGRRVFHTPEFLADERRFADYARARRWERENVDRLLGGEEDRTG